MNTNEILNGLSAEQQDELLKQLTAKKQQKDLDKRKAYEDIRENFAKSVKDKVVEISLRVKDFRDWLDKESEGFKAVMAEYGKLRNKEQRGFTIVVDDFRFEVKSQDVKGFDERSEMAAQRLMDFLGAYIATETASSTTRASASSMPSKASSTMKSTPASWISSERATW